MDTPSLERTNTRKHIFKRGIHFLYRLFIAPRSADEDTRRHEFILNSILTVSIVLGAILSVFAFADLLLQEHYQGIRVVLIVLITCFYVGLLILSKKGKGIAASYILVAVYFASTVYGLHQWGVELPLAILSCALMISIASVLISTEFGFIVGSIVSVTVLILGFLQVYGISTPQTYWKSENLTFNDPIELALMFFIIMVLSWLSNRETEKSLARARASEYALTLERDNLEQTVEERTRDLKTAQLEKMSQLYRFAEFGRLSSGLFHDLINPLTAISLQIDTLDHTCHSTIPCIQDSIRRAVHASKRMDHYLQAVRKQIHLEDTKSFFSVNTEAAEAITLLEYQARVNQVRIKFHAHSSIRTYGNPLKLHQAVVNLVSNAIDACAADTPPESNKQHTVHISLILAKDKKEVLLFVSDNGCGIPADSIEHIFDPFFTTKPHEKGTGLGLSTTKRVIEHDFDGSISAVNKKTGGALFIVRFPITKEPKNQPTH
ncbi:MAG TPA: ATP-binding protein [Candidatus Paceibacterota bacterium]|nr:ATP-binding protein [Candidatus Paceibacterota bacterium]